MVRILSKDHYLCLSKGRQIESIKYIASFWIDRITPISFFQEKFFDIGKIWLLKFLKKNFFSCFVDIWVDSHGGNSTKAEKENKPFALDIVYILFYL